MENSTFGGKKNQNLLNVFLNRNENLVFKKIILKNIHSKVKMLKIFDS